MRREGKGVTGCSGALMREDERGKKGGDGAPFIGNVVGVVDGPRAVPHGGEAWGVGLAHGSGDVVWPAAARPRRSRAARS
jgi:hypothetical protein